MPIWFTIGLAFFYALIAWVTWGWLYNLIAIPCSLYVLVILLSRILGGTWTAMCERVTASMWQSPTARNAAGLFNNVAAILIGSAITWFAWGSWYLIAVPAAAYTVLQTLGLAAALLTNIEPQRPQWMDTVELRIARTRAFARQQMRAARAMPPSDARRHSHLVNALRLLRSLPDDQRDAHTIMLGASLLAQSSRPDTAEAAASELQQLLPSLDPVSEEASDVQRALRTLGAASGAALPASELRSCGYCGARRPREAFTSNQWHKTPRRCRSCQEAGVLSTITQRAEHQAEKEAADALALAQVQVRDAEAQRIREELERRNANEHTDDDCCICFESFAPSAKCTLPCSTRHWVCTDCFQDLASAAERRSEALKCPHCRTLVPDAALRRLLHHE